MLFHNIFDSSIDGGEQKPKTDYDKSNEDEDEDQNRFKKAKDISCTT